MVFNTAELLPIQKTDDTKCSENRIYDFVCLSNNYIRASEFSNLFNR